jgi:hypothetical protein
VYKDTGSILPYVAGTLGVWTLFDYIGEPVSYRRYYTLYTVHYALYTIHYALY